MRCGGDVEPGVPQVGRAGPGIRPGFFLSTGINFLLISNSSYLNIF